MATKTYVLDIRLGCVSAGSDDYDLVAEFYGSFSYRPQGQSSWIQIAQTSDNSPWIIREKDGLKVLPVGFKVEIPTSSTFIEVQSSIKEYDPTVFNADEDLGTQTISIPVPTPGSGGEYKQGFQGNASIGQADIQVTLVPAEEWSYRG